MNREPITFGIKTPKDLLEKLNSESQKVDDGKNNPYDIFNFIITASVLWEWIGKHYKNSTAIDLEAVKRALDDKPNEENTIPQVCASWIKDMTCIPNKHADVREDILCALLICNHTANASKHYVWHKTNPVKAVSEKPLIVDGYQYCFTSRLEDVYLTIKKKHYAFYQVRGIVLQFFTGLIELLEQHHNIKD